LTREIMLRIHIGSIMDTTGWILDEQVEPLLLPLIADVSREGSAQFTQPVHARVRATMAGESVAIEGRLQTAVRLICSRCLEPFEFIIDTDFSAVALPEKPTLNDSRSTDAIELSADEMDVIPYTGDSIDLRDEIAQQIIMVLPFKPLCRETCKGLCSRCGIDLNHHACQCHNQNQGSPFAVLKTLSFPPKKE
jgi:uncharacterized protein